MQGGFRGVMGNPPLKILFLMTFTCIVYVVGHLRCTQTEERLSASALIHIN